MKRFFSLGAAFVFLSTIVAACTMDFDQFQAGGGNGGTGGTGGSNTCGGCCDAGDCPVPSGVCVQAACINSQCSEVPVSDGTPVGTQTVGDCKKEVCQGGMVFTDNDDSDTKNDNNDCTDDLCVSGAPTSMPAGAGAECMNNGGAVCDGLGVCVECLGNGDCPPSAPTCDLGSKKCVPASCTDMILNGTETDLDCGGGTCPPCNDGLNCDQGSDCSSGVCPPNGKCAAPDCNDGVKNGDETDVDCGGGCTNKCGPDQGCNDDSDCEGNDCTGMAGTCVPNCNDNVVNNAETDVDCGGNTCGGCNIGEMCAGDNANCLSNNCGAGDLCIKKVVGSTCGGDGECLSNNCDDNVCCNMSCNGQCRSCALPGTVGTCTNYALGTDPQNECANGSTCNGAGACRKEQGTTCANTNECLMGLSCRDGVCCNMTCNGTCEACNIAGSVGTCTDVPDGLDPANECAAGQVCDGAGACRKLADGAVCVGGGDCTSTFCVDGFCCDEACGATCKSCGLAGTLGVCTNVPSGQDPDNECAGAANCDGAGVCM